MAPALRSVPTPKNAPAPAAATTWPIPGDVPDLNQIVDDQAAAIASQAALIDAYQGNLAAAQNPVQGPAATATATATGTQLAVSATPAITGTIVVGATITDPAGVTVPAGTTILGQISGTPGKDGVYLTSGPTTAASTVLTFTPPPTPQNWPVPQDPLTLNLIAQYQIAVLRVQSALIQHYQDLLTTSQTPAPPTGP